MGKVAAFFREQSIPLAGQPKQKMLALDAQFEDLETERDALKVENLHLKAQVHPLEREIERLTNQINGIQKKATHDDDLDETAEKLLLTIANDSEQRFSEQYVPLIIGGTQAQATYYLGLLRQNGFIVQTSYEPISYGPEQKGLEYLKKIGKL